MSSNARKVFYRDSTVLLLNGPDRLDAYNGHIETRREVLLSDSLSRQY